MIEPNEVRTGPYISLDSGGLDSAMAAAADDLFEDSGKPSG